jgi:hypothetical protein
MWALFSLCRVACVCVAGELQSQLATAAALHGAPTLRMSFTDNSRHEHDTWGRTSTHVPSQISDESRDESLAVAAVNALIGSRAAGALYCSHIHTRAGTDCPPHCVKEGVTRWHLCALSAVFISPSNSLWTTFVGHLMGSDGVEIQQHSYACGGKPGASVRELRSRGGFLRVLRAAGTAEPWAERFWTALRAKAATLGCTGM